MLDKSRSSEPLQLALDHCLVENIKETTFLNIGGGHIVIPVHPTISIKEYYVMGCN